MNTSLSIFVVAAAKKRERKDGSFKARKRTMVTVTWQTIRVHHHIARDVWLRWLTIWGIHSRPVHHSNPTNCTCNSLFVRSWLWKHFCRLHWHLKQTATPFSKVLKHWGTKVHISTSCLAKQSKHPQSPDTACHWNLQKQLVCLGWGTWMVLKQPRSTMGNKWHTTKQPQIRCTRKLLVSDATIC